MNDTTYDTSLYETYCKSYVIWSVTFLVTFALYVIMKGQFVSSSGLYFIKKKLCIGNPMICQFTLVMACDLIYLLVKFSR